MLPEGFWVELLTGHFMGPFQLGNCKSYDSFQLEENAHTRYFLKSILQSSKLPDYISGMRLPPQNSSVQKTVGASLLSLYLQCTSPE